MNPYRELWEQPVLDFWSLPHLLSGVIFFFLFRTFRIHPVLAFTANLAIAILWEVFEKTTGVSSREYFTNHLADIVFAVSGYTLAIFASDLSPTDRIRNRIFWTVVGAFATACLIGILSAQLAQAA